MKHSLVKNGRLATGERADRAVEREELVLVDEVEEVGRAAGVYDAVIWPALSERLDGGIVGDVDHAVSAELGGDLQAARVDVGDGDVGAERAGGLRHGLADQPQAGNPHTHGRGDADAPRVPEAYARNAKECAKLMLDFGRQFDADALALVGGGEIDEVPAPMAAVIAQKHRLARRELVDATPHYLNNAHMLVACAGREAAAEIGHQCVAFGAVGYAGEKRSRNDLGGARLGRVRQIELSGFAQFRELNTDKFIVPPRLNQ